MIGALLLNIMAWPLLVPAALLLLQRARLAAALGDTVTARGRLEHAIEIAGAPRLDSLVIQQGSALRTSLRR